MNERLKTLSIIVSGLLASGHYTFLEDEKDVDSLPFIREIDSKFVVVNDAVDILKQLEDEVKKMC